MESPAFNRAARSIQFYQYRPDSEARHSAVFTPMPMEQPVYSPMAGYQHPPPPPYVATQYWQPTPTFARGHFVAQRMMTPAGSPPLTLTMPMPKIVIDHNGHYDNGPLRSSPVTPCLSACPSTASSPPASSAARTPVNGRSYFNLPIESCKDELPAFPLVDEWSDNEIHIFPHPGDAKIDLAVSSRSSSGCTSPSLSPATPDSFSSASRFPVSEFVNLRDLTANSFEQVLTASVQDFPPLPTLSVEDEEHKFVLGNTTFPVTPEHDISDPFSIHDTPSFDSSFYTEFDSEDEFSFVNFPDADVPFKGDKRQKLTTVEEEDFVSVHSFGSFDEDDCFANLGLPSPPPSSLSDSDSCCAHDTLSNKRMKRDVSVDDEFDFHPHACAEGHTSTHADGQNQAPSSSTSQSQPGSAEAVATTPGNSDASGQQGQAPTNRRGRKQSLTEDPSKTFVCTLCSRRFRRQEHLKRHYRSLHTHDKPFECNECGKRFSRSDNLAQHARTHGSGSIVMGVLENGELQPHGAYDDEMGHVLYEAAHRAAMATSSSGSGSESSSSSDSKRANKKRKRDDSM